MAEQKVASKKYNSVTVSAAPAAKITKVPSKPVAKPAPKPAVTRDAYPSRASVGAGYITKDTKPSATKTTAPKPAPKPAVTRDAYPNRASVGAGYITKDTTPSITKSTPSASPIARFINQARFGMNDEAQAEYNRLARTDSDWWDISDAERVRRAREPQMSRSISERTKSSSKSSSKSGSKSSSKSKPEPEMRPVQAPVPSINDTALTDIDETINSKLPGWQKMRKAGQRRYGFGRRRGTLLTGHGGISDDALVIGRSLLGGY